jgi:vacuolar-type H+-ATPase subunit F/Vma7
MSEHQQINYGKQHVTPPPDNQKNFLVVDIKTETSAIEAAFDKFTQERKDIAILLINQHVCGNDSSFTRYKRQT